MPPAPSSLGRRNDKEAVLGSERLVKATDAAIEKATRKDDSSPGTVFSAFSLPTEVYTDIFAAWGAKSVLDLSAGQDQSAAACLQLRLCCVAFCLTEAHAQALEKRLTGHVLTAMQDEGSTFYRPETAQKKETTETEEPKTIQSRRETRSQVARRLLSLSRTRIRRKRKKTQMTKIMRRSTAQTPCRGESGQTALCGASLSCKPSGVERGRRCLWTLLNLCLGRSWP